MGCKGLHCDGCGHGGGPAAAVIALLVIVALALRKAWPEIVHAVEIAAWTVAAVAVAVILITGTVLTAQTVRRVRARRALRQATYRAAPVIPAARLIERPTIDPPAGHPALGQPPRHRPGAWPLPGWWEDIRPWIGGDSDEHRPGNPAITPAAGPCTAAPHFTAPVLPSKETPAMTTTLPADPARTAAAAILRAVADLIETRPDLPEPGSSVSFYLHGEDAPAAMAAIASALPCEWQASIRRSGEHEWLNLDSNAPVTSVTRGARVHISAPATDACTPSGARTVTIWQPAAALAELVGSEPLGEVA